MDNETALKAIMVRETTEDYKKLSDFVSLSPSEKMEKNYYASTFDSAYPGIEEEKFAGYSHDIRIYLSLDTDNQPNVFASVMQDNDGDTYHYRYSKGINVFFGGGGNDVIRIVAGDALISLGTGRNIVVYDNVPAAGDKIISDFNSDDKILFVDMFYSVINSAFKEGFKIDSEQGVHDYLISKMVHHIDEYGEKSTITIARPDGAGSSIVIQDMAPEDFESGQFIFV